MGVNFPVTGKLINKYYLRVYTVYMTGTSYAFKTGKFGFVVKNYLYYTKFVTLLLNEDLGQIFWSVT